MSGDSLTDDSQLKNAESVSPYSIHQVRYLNQFYHMRIKDFRRGLEGPTIMLEVDILSWFHQVVPSSLNLYRDGSLPITKVSRAKRFACLLWILIGSEVLIV